jgi:hypothetical protein
VGPIFAASSFEVHPPLPYLICAGLSLATSILAWRCLWHCAPAVVNRKPTPGHKPDEVGQASSLP